MSGAVTSFCFNPATVVLRSAVTSLSAQQTNLQNQTASGVRADNYAALGSTRAKALGLQPAITQVQAWQTNIKTAQSKLDVTQTALSRISQIGADLQTTLVSLAGSTAVHGVDAARSQATQALHSLSDLLNTKNGDDYVFAGRESRDAPIVGDENLALSPLANSVAKAVSGLGADSDAVLTQTMHEATDTASGAPFSAALSTTAQDAATKTVMVSVGQNMWLSTGMVATQGNASATDRTSGSPVRDLIRNLMVVASLDTDTPHKSGYAGLIQGLLASSQTASDGLTAMQADLGVTQNQMTDQAKLASHMEATLTSQLDDAKTVNLAEVSSQLTQTQTQLQASYAIIADLKDMSLTSYL